MTRISEHHHGVTPRRDGQLFATPDGWFWWRTPGGDTFWSQGPATQQHASRGSDRSRVCGTLPLDDLAT